MCVGAVAVVQAFHGIDRDGNKALDEQELYSMLGKDYADWFIEHAMKIDQMGGNNDGEIQLAEFESFFNQLLADEGREYAKQVLADVEVSVRAAAVWCGAICIHREAAGDIAQVGGRMETGWPVRLC